MNSSSWLLELSLSDSLNKKDNSKVSYLFLYSSCKTSFFLKELLFYMFPNDLLLGYYNNKRLILIANSFGLKGFAIKSLAFCF